MLSDSDDWQPVTEKIAESKCLLKIWQNTIYMLWKRSQMEPFTQCYLYFLSCWHDFFQITQYLILKVITRILNTLLFVYRSPPCSGRLSQGSLQGHLRWGTNTSGKPELSNCSTVFDKWIKQTHLKSLTQDPRMNITDLLIPFLVKKKFSHILIFFFVGGQQCLVRKVQRPKVTSLQQRE